MKLKYFSQFKLYIKSLVIILLFFSCIQCNEETKKKKVTKKPKHVIQLPKLPKDKNLYYSDMCDTVKHVPLETSDSSLIGKINSIRMTDSLIFIGDHKRTKSIFVFNKQGKYIKKLHKVGKGPGEYNRIDRFSIDTANNRMYVYDGLQGKILVYRLSDFQFIDSWMLEFFTSTAFGWGGKIFFYQNGDQINKDQKYFYQLLVLNPKTKEIEEQYLPYTKEDQFSLIVQKNFTPVGKKLYFHQSLSTKFYVYTNEDKLEYLYKLRFHEDNKPFIRSQFKGKSTDECIDIINKEDLQYVDDYAISRNWLYVKIRSSYCIYNRNTKEVKVGKKFINNFSYSRVNGDEEILHHDWLVSEVEPSVMKKHLPETFLKKHFGGVEKWYSGNPILLFAKLSTE